MNVMHDFSRRRENCKETSNTFPQHTNRLTSFSAVNITARALNFRVRNQQSMPRERAPKEKGSVVKTTPVHRIVASASMAPPSGSVAAGSRSHLTGPSTAVFSTRSSATSRALSSATRRQTPSSAFRTPKSTLSVEQEACFIVALAEGRGHARGEVGLAAIDLRRPHLTVCQLSDNQTYSNTLSKINIFNPAEVLLPSTVCDSKQPNKLLESLREQYPTVTITTVQRRHFNEANGLLLIQKLCARPYSNVEVLVSQRFYALAATAALLKYVEFVQNMVFVPHSLKVEYQGSNNTMFIDIMTAKRLELVACATRDATSISLLGTLNLCRTLGGSRLLRSYILQPPCVQEDIERNLDCVEELVNSPSLYHNVQGALTKLAECEQLLGLSMAAPTSGSLAARHAENQLSYVLLLKTCLDSLPHLLDALSDAQSNFLCESKEKLKNPSFENLKEQIKKTLHDDAHTEKGFSAAHLQRCFAVRTGVNGLLDVARKTYCELVDDITTMVNDYKDNTGLPLRVGFSASRGFHIQLPLSGPNARLRNLEIPAMFIQVNTSKCLMTMTTQELVHIDLRCKEALGEIQTMSNIVISELLTIARQHAGSLYELCETVSHIDLIQCFAGASSLPGYVRPGFGHNMCVTASQHPILNFVHHTQPVANDIFASEEKNFIIITGPNMGGKSVYLRQVALLQILAQIGCFVPAESAVFRLTDRIFARIGCEDSMECNASTFALEIREMALVLQSLTPRTLLIVDELCRGTSNEEGAATAWALCERLLDTRAFTFFTTHFLFLTKLEDLYPNITNRQFLAEEADTAAPSSDDEEAVGSFITYTHRLVDGVTRLERYGVKLAKLSNMPSLVTAAADQLLQTLTATRKPVGDNISGLVGPNLSTLYTALYDASVSHSGTPEDWTLVCKKLAACFPDANKLTIAASCGQIEGDATCQENPSAATGSGSNGKNCAIIPILTTSPGQEESSERCSPSKKQPSPIAPEGQNAERDSVSMQLEKGIAAITEEPTKNSVTDPYKMSEQQGGKRLDSVHAVDSIMEDFSAKTVSYTIEAAASRTSNLRAVSHTEQFNSPLHSSSRQYLSENCLLQKDPCRSLLLSDTRQATRVSPDVKSVGEIHSVELNDDASLCMQSTGAAATSYPNETLRSDHDDVAMDYENESPSYSPLYSQNQTEADDGTGNNVPVTVNNPHSHVALESPAQVRPDEDRLQSVCSGSVAAAFTLPGDVKSASRLQVAAQPAEYHKVPPDLSQPSPIITFRRNSRVRVSGLTRSNVV